VISDFLKYQAQTTPHPLALEVSHAKGSYIYDSNGKGHLDFVAGVSACSVGHTHPKLVQAIQEQTAKYMHVMVYGEYAQKPAIDYTKALAALLPKGLDCTYLVNSGTEAIEGAMKLARRATGRHEIIAAHHAYHGNTMGSLSVMGYEDRKAAFRPLVPGVRFIHFNAFIELSLITEKTAAVLLETIQGGAGFICPNNGYLKAVKERCEAVGALLILDEIQPGFGRTGALFAFEHYQCVPHILVVGKGMAGGLPVGAFIASKPLMDLLQEKPSLGHITTFGGNPVIASACKATLEIIQEENLMAQTLEKEAFLRRKLQHPDIKEIRGKGLMLALILASPEKANELVLEASKNGLILFWLLFEKKAVRISPPLTISMDELEKGCDLILKILDKNTRTLN
jgi:acetylornithine/succinyldiaminopimelate/putrescine aminotransferase